MIMISFLRLGRRRRFGSTADRSRWHMSMEFPSPPGIIATFSSWTRTNVDWPSYLNIFDHIWPGQRRILMQTLRAAIVLRWVSVCDSEWQCARLLRKSNGEIWNLSEQQSEASWQSVHLQQQQLKNNLSGNESISDIWLRAQAFEFWSEIVWQWHGADIFSFRPNAKHFTLNSAQICNKNYIT